MAQDLISIIVLTHNSKDHIQNCVTSIFEQNYDNFELIIVDNASDNETRNILKSIESKYLEKIKIIFNSSNLGYNFGNKIGFDSSHGDYIAVINPDVILDTFWLSKIMKYFDQNPKFECVCGTLKNKKNEIISTGGLMDIYGAVRQRKDTKKLDLDFFYHPGSAFVFRKSLLDKLTLDPNLFLYYDDVDFAWQLRLLNMKVGFCEESYAIHDEGHSNPKMTLSKYFHITKNRIYICRKNYSSKTLFKRFYKILFFLFLGSIYYSYKNKSISYFSTFFKSLFWNLSRGKSLKIQRKIIQEKRLVNDSEIEKFMIKNSIEMKMFTSN